MGIALTAFVNGITLSAAYIMVALGFALLLSIMGIFNFAHGSIYMVGAFITYGLAIAFGINQFAALLISMIVIGSFGLFLEKFCFRPFGGSPVNVIVVSIALSLILETTVVVTLGGDVRALPAFFPGSINGESFAVSNDRLLVLGVGIILFIGMIFIQNSKVGQQMLAVAQNRDGAALQGININRTAAIATVIACALAALSGTLMSSLFILDPFMGSGILIKAIEIVILSGIGSFGGILTGGLIVGFMDAVLPLILGSPSVAQEITIAVLIIILLVRPKGLFGYELF